MENMIDTTKNVTLSFKTTSKEKIALQQIANEKNISRSELIASLVHAYKHSYDYIEKLSPREQQLTSELETVKKQNRKMTLSLENAEHRIEIERQANKKHVIEQFEMNKTIFNLQEKLKTTSLELNRLNEIINSYNTTSSSTNNNYDVFYGSLASMILSGVTLFFMPSLFKN